MRTVKQYYTSNDPSRFIDGYQTKYQHYQECVRENRGPIRLRIDREHQLSEQSEVANKPKPREEKKAVISYLLNSINVPFV